jgi:diguanylate cyclase (GGDEF)-like protein/PAS domain S-box-containing protein
MQSLEAVFRESISGIAETNSVGLITDVNPAFCAILGRRADELIATRLADLFHPDDAGSARAAFEAVACGRIPDHDGDIRFVGRDGSTIIANTRLCAVGDPDASAAGAASVLVFIADLTASRTTERMLRAEIDGYEQLWQDASSAIVILSATGKVVRVYPGFTRLFGYSPEEVVGRPIQELIGSKENVQEIEANIKAALAGHSINAEVVRRRRDGRSIHVSILGRRYSPADGERRIFLLYRDISDRKEAEALIQRLSTTDDLTGLWNRRGFYTLAAQEIQRAARERAGLILIYADLDNFKRINDEYGHAEGDRALAAVARALLDSCRGSDTIARMGGDEFVMLASGVPDGEHILKKRIRNGIMRLNQRRNRPYSLRLSLGSMYFEPEHENQVSDLDGMISLVDRRMYEDKARSIEASA